MISFLYKEHTFRLITLLWNFIVIISFGFLGYLYYKTNNELKNEIHLCRISQFEMQDKLTTLNKNLLFLKSENAILSEKLNLQNMSASTTQNTSDEYKIFIIKLIVIITAIIIISFVVYFLSTSIYSWFCQSFIGKLVIATNNLGLKLVGLLGATDIKTLTFTDSVGNDFTVTLLKNDKIVEILIKTKDMTREIPITEYVRTLANDIESLNRIIQSFTLAANQINSTEVIAASTNLLNPNSIDIANSVLTKEQELALSAQAIEHISSLFS